jgi:hypothetical protein
VIGLFIGLFALVGPQTPTWVIVCQAFVFGFFQTSVAHGGGRRERESARSRRADVKRRRRRRSANWRQLVILLTGCLEK